MDRIIFHVDMDAFYASVEQRREPSYRGRPVIVGADPQQGRGRGVVAACSYEARRFGVHSAMPISRAFRACPDGIFLRPDFEQYVAVSRNIRTIFHSHASRVEPISIDEAFLDFSDVLSEGREALALAARLKRDIFQQERLTASVGIGPCKLVAKIASDFNKPNGLHMVKPDQVQEFLDPLPASRIWGVGPKTSQRLQALGVQSIHDLRQLSFEDLSTRFGKFGRHLWKLARGIDERRVSTRRETKSVSQETTFPSDIDDVDLMHETVRRQAAQVAKRCRKAALQGRTVTLKLRYQDFATFTRQMSSRFPTDDAEVIAQAALRLLDRNLEKDRLVRLIGVGLSHLVSEDDSSPRQLLLF